VLRAHDWNFAITLQSINAEVTAPIDGYSYQFVLPTDPYCLRVIEVNDDPEADWVIQGRRLHSDDSTVIVKYVAQITESGIFDSLFVEALAVKMAVNLAMPITKDEKKMIAMQQLYQMKLNEAMGLNDHERGNVPEPTSPFISVR
jgi:hypothetical protein